MRRLERRSPTEGNRLAFLQKHAADPLIAAALLSAPPFLSGLSEPNWRCCVARSKRNGCLLRSSSPRPRSATRDRNRTQPARRASHDPQRRWRRKADRGRTGYGSATTSRMSKVELRMPSPALKPRDKQQRRGDVASDIEAVDCAGDGHAPRRCALWERVAFSLECRATQPRGRGGQRSTGLFHIPTKGAELCDCPCK